MLHHYRLRIGSGLTSRFTPIVAATVVAATAFAGCGGDEEASWEVSASLSSRSLNADGSDSANAVLFVLDQDRNPAPIGSALLVTCVNQAQQPAGRLNGSDTGVAQLQLDSLGGAELEIRCSGDADTDDTLICFARYEGENSVLPIINCRS